MEKHRFWKGFKVLAIHPHQNFGEYPTWGGDLGVV